MTLNDFIPFVPSKDNPRLISRQSGVYIVLIRALTSLPNRGYDVSCKKFRGLDVVYVGRSKSNLYKRIWNRHLGKVSGNSTLRHSLGCLFGFKQFPRDEDNKENDFIRFSDENEAWLTDWMKNNLIFYFHPCDDFKLLESALIKSFNPPLNLEGDLAVEDAQLRASIQVSRHKTPWQTEYQKVQALLKELNR